MDNCQFNEYYALIVLCILVAFYLFMRDKFNLLSLIFFLLYSGCLILTIKLYPFGCFRGMFLYFFFTLAHIIIVFVINLVRYK